MSFMWEAVFIVKWCPVYIDDARFNHMHDFIYGSCVYSCIVVIKGASVHICVCFLVG